MNIKYCLKDVKSDEWTKHLRAPLQNHMLTYISSIQQKNYNQTSSTNVQMPFQWFNPASQQVCSWVKEVAMPAALWWTWRPGFFYLNPTSEHIHLNLLRLKTWAAAIVNIFHFIDNIKSHVIYLSCWKYNKAWATQYNCLWWCPWWLSHLVFKSLVQSSFWTLIRCNCNHNQFGLHGQLPKTGLNHIQLVQISPVVVTQLI